MLLVRFEVGLCRPQRAARGFPWNGDIAFMFSPAVLALSSQPFHMGALSEADAVGQEGFPGEGPYMTVYLKWETGERVAEAWFETYGCPSCIACGSFLTRWVAGRTYAQARLLEAEDLRRVLGGLPLGKEHCADLAVNALRKALRRMEGE